MASKKTSRRPRGGYAWLVIWKAAKSLEVYARRSVESTGLCLSDFAVLEALLHKGPLSVGELGRKVLLTSGSITTAVDRLERGRLVERAGVESDRRSRIVHLTPPGAQMIRKIFAVHERDMDRAFSALTATELAAMTSILRKLGLAAVELAKEQRAGNGFKKGR
jgi:MarR family 2-MHQ and catechol resistance regulon transcriptional repressor